MPKYIVDYPSLVLHTKVYQKHEHNSSWSKCYSCFPFVLHLSSSFQNPKHHQKDTWKQLTRWMWTNKLNNLSFFKETDVFWCSEKRFLNVHYISHFRNEQSNKPICSGLDITFHSFLTFWFSNHGSSKRRELTSKRRPRRQLKFIQTSLHPTHRYCIQIHHHMWFHIILYLLQPKYLPFCAFPELHYLTTDDDLCLSTP